MNKKKWSLLISVIISLLFQITFFNISSGEEIQERLKIVATTSMLGNITKAIGKDNVEVVTIVPSGLCPGHFDICPKHAQLIEDARVVLDHGFEGELFLDNMLRSNRNSDLRRLSLKVSKYLMVPEFHLRAVDEIAQFIGSIDSVDKDIFLLQAARYKEHVKYLSEAVTRELTKLEPNKIKVVASEMQAEFAEWLGFNVISIFGRQEEMSPRDLLKITHIAKNENIKIVIDNLQSGSKIGKQLAEDIGGKHVILTNFPRGDSYLEALKENVDRLIQACEWVQSSR